MEIVCFFHRLDQWFVQLETGTKWIGYEELELGDILYNTAYFEYVDKGSSFASGFLGTLMDARTQVC